MGSPRNWVDLQLRKPVYSKFGLDTVGYPTQERLGTGQKCHSYLSTARISVQERFVPISGKK